MELLRRSLSDCQDTEGNGTTATMMDSLVLLWVTFCLFFFLFKAQRPKNFPPGPFSLPIFGNLLQLNLENPINDLKKLRMRYGNVYSICFGSRPVVVLNGVHAVKEALVNQSVEFAGRPQDLMINHVTKNEGVVLLNHGPVWRNVRRFSLMTLRNFGLGKQSMEERILGEVSYITSHLEKCAGKSMDPQNLFHKAASNIITTVLFGTRYEHEDKFLQLFIQLFQELSKIANGPWAMIYDTFPVVRNLPLPFQKAFKKFEVLKDAVKDLISQHKMSWVPRQPRDLLDCYLDEMEKRDDDSSFNESQLVTLLLDLHFAGTDTTSNTLLTAFLYLMTHPDVQERCQKEIDQVLGEKPQASFEDRHRMPYTQAMIHEAQRVADTVPLSVFHATTKDTQLMGYDIPK
ncbi:hypothetical protein JZ751_020956, partial [Albula glossodonta]